MRMVEVRILPPQPISLLRTERLGPALILCHWQACIYPSFPSAIHRFDIVVAHLLQVFRHQRGSESASAVQDQLPIRIGYLLLDVAFDDAFAQVDGAGEMPLG